MIQTAQLGKRFGRHWALRHCDLSIPPGRVAALVGPNGAGKTTLLQLLVGLLRPSEGSVHVLGLDPWRSGNRILPQIGFVAQNHPLYSQYAIEDILCLGRHLNRRWDMVAARRRLSQLGVPLSAHVGQLSDGQHAQLALTLALAKMPQLLVLDEPLASLDPLARQELLDSLRNACQEFSLTVVLSSHIIADLEDVCDFLVVISASRVLVADSVTVVLSRNSSTPPNLGERSDQQAGTRPRDGGVGPHSVGSDAISVPAAARRQRSPLEEVVLAYMRLSRQDRTDEIDS